MQVVRSFVVRIGIATGAHNEAERVFLAATPRAPAARAPAAAATGRVLCDLSAKKILLHAN